MKEQAKARLSGRKKGRRLRTCVQPSVACGAGIAAAAAPARGTTRSAAASVGLCVPGRWSLLAETPRLQDGPRKAEGVGNDGEGNSERSLDRGYDQSGACGEWSAD